MRLALWMKALVCALPLIVGGSVQASPQAFVAGKVYCDANQSGVLDVGDTPESGVLVELWISGDTEPIDWKYTGLDGGYNFLVAPNAHYLVRVVPGAGTSSLASYGAHPYGVSIDASNIAVNGIPNGVTSESNDFLLSCPPTYYGTFTMGGWGSPPNGHNPGTVLANHFGSVFPLGYVDVGNGSKKMRFTTALAIRHFLPAGGTPKALTGYLLNPKKSPAGVFGGQVLALKLNVCFSLAGVTGSPIGSLRVASGPAMGRTVLEVLAEAERLLGGGLPAAGWGIQIPTMNNIVTAINENFVDGANKGFLIP
jgi:hypothetical protein